MTNRKEGSDASGAGEEEVGEHRPRIVGDGGPLVHAQAVATPPAVVSEPTTPKNVWATCPECGTQFWEPIYIPTEGGDRPAPVHDTDADVSASGLRVERGASTGPAVVSDSFEALLADIERYPIRSDKEWADRLRALLEKERERYESAHRVSIGYEGMVRELNVALAAKDAELRQIHNAWAEKENDYQTTVNALAAKTEELEKWKHAFECERRDWEKSVQTNDRLRAVMLECALGCRPDEISIRLREEAGK